MQRKTHRPVQFELTEQTREAVQAWIAQAKLTGDQFLLESHARIAALVYAPVRQNRRCLGLFDRSRSQRVWNPYDALEIAEQTEV
jgi:hypothetical protein